MKGHWTRKIFKFALLAVVAAVVLGFLVMQLWNWLVPAIFAGPMITYWQALGLLVLSKILFGRRGFGGQRMFWRHRMMERLEKMTPEEREKFRAGMKGRCGPFGESGAEGKA